MLEGAEGGMIRMRNGNEMTMEHKTCHSLLKNYKISVEFATAIVKNFMPNAAEAARGAGQTKPRQDTAEKTLFLQLIGKLKCKI